MSANTQIIISHRQFAWLICSLLTGGGLLSLQHELVRIAQLDAWMTYLLPTLYALAIAFVLTRLANRFPRKHLFEIVSIVFGRFFGTIVNLVILLHLWLILMRNLKAFNQFIGTTLLPNTPPGILVMLFMLLLIFFGRTSIEVAARVNELFFPFFFLQIILSPLVLSNEVDRQLITPILTLDLKDYTFASMLGIGWFGDVLVAGAFLHTLWNVKQLRSAFRHGIILSALLLSVSLFMLLIVLGPIIPGNMVYPNYSLVQHIHITDFLDRVDLFILSIWYPITGCKIIMIYLAFLTGIASLFKQRDYTVINSPISLFLLLTTTLAFKSTTEVLSFGELSSPVIVACYQPLLLIGLLAGSLRFPKPKQQEQKGREPSESHENEGDEEISGQHPERTRGRYGATTSKKVGGRLSRIPAPVWTGTGNAALIVCVVLSAVGLTLGPLYSKAGTACGAGYAFFLLAAYLVSHMEMRKAADYNLRRPSSR
ncbi:endospore germination permease [Paenibacillus filicis]|uniref:Endospore germination permease n=1 Tax=Paenibacillus filicis TaxID=669464 RepID=A0ABU9DGW1_9BACL